MLESFLSIVDFTLSAQSTPELVQPCIDCAGTAFTKIAATFSTLGYYAQARWLNAIFDEGMSTWVMLAYMCSFIGALIGFVMGAPPKKFIWFVIGPALFYWLVENRTAVNGVNWAVGTTEFGQRDMREVWKMAETGLVNDSYIIRNNFVVFTDRPPINNNPRSECFQSACVSDFFAFYDRLVSDTIAQLVHMLGVNRATLDPRFANADNLIMKSSNGDIAQNDVFAAESTKYQKWDLTSQLKWEFFASITQARLTNPDLRQAWTAFFSNECGDAFVKSIDKRRMVAAYHNKGSLSHPILEVTSGQVPSLSVDPLLNVPLVQFSQGQGFTLWSNLGEYRIPTPKPIRNLLRVPKGFDDAAAGQIYEGSDNRVGVESMIVHIGEYYKGRSPLKLYVDTTVNPAPLIAPTTTQVAELTGNSFFKDNPVDISDTINCRTFLVVLLQGLRWEAAHVAYQIMNGAPPSVSTREYVYHMLYGWDIKIPEGSGERNISVEEARKFMENMILVHLFRNEMETVPALFIEKKHAVGQAVTRNVDDFQRVNNQKAKYGELYAWAKMVPYFQGKLLYILAIIYPFACVMIVIPGMHKAVFQWMQVWLWAKLWDLGFAVVMVLERAIWASVGNTTDRAAVSDVVIQLQALNNTVITPDPPQRDIFLPDFVSVPLPDIASSSGPFATTQVDQLGHMLDRLLVLMGNKELDLASTYYVYIMSALYFAVPVITGQLVLGAKGGIAGAFQSAMGGISQPAGSAAGSSAVADMQSRFSTAQGVGKQESYRKAMRQGGYAKQAISAANSAAMDGLEGSYKGSMGQMINDGTAQRQASRSQVGNANQILGTVAQGIQTGYYMTNGLFGRGGQEAAVANALGEGSTAPGVPSPGSGAPGGGGRSPAAGGWIGASGKLAVGVGVPLMQIGAGLGPLNEGIRAESDISSMKDLGTQMSIGGFGAQGSSQLGNLDAGRLDQAANFAAEDAAVDSMDRGFNMQSSEFFGAIGGSPGSLGAGPRPTSMVGDAYGGGMGAGAKQAAQAASGGGSMRAQLGGLSGGLGRSWAGSYGRDALYRDHSVGQALGSLGSNYAQSFGDLASNAADGRIQSGKGVIDVGYRIMGGELLDWGEAAKPKEE